MKCPNCGNTVQDDAMFCDQCGATLQQTSAAPAGPSYVSTPEPASPSAPSPEPGRAIEPPAMSTACPACGAENMPGEMFCVDCGTPLQAPMPEEPLAVQEQPAEQPAAVPQVHAGPETAFEPAPMALTAESQAASQPASVPAISAPEPAPAASPLVCTACSAALDPGDAFCSACGTKVEAPASVSAPAAVQTPTPAAPVAQDATAAQQAPAAAPATSAPQPTSPAHQVSPLTECPACGASVTPGGAFCEFCGAALVVPVAHAAAHPVTGGASAYGTASAAPSAPVGTMSGDRPRLIVPDTGNELPLILDTEMLVGREDAYSNLFPDVDLTPYGAEDKGVSRRHFKLTLAEGQYVIQDLASTNYTFLNQQRLDPNVPVRIKDGDEIRAGRLRLVFRTSP